MRNVEKVLGIKLEPRTVEQKAHNDLSARALRSKDNAAGLTDLINEMAALRKKLG